MTLIGKPGCHLCDGARAVVCGVIDDLAAVPDAPRIAFDELSILDDDALMSAYVNDIPVVTIDGKVHTFWRVDAARLRDALIAAGRA